MTANVSITFAVLKHNSLPYRNQESEDYKTLKDFFLLVGCFEKKNGSFWIIQDFDMKHINFRDLPQDDLGSTVLGMVKRSMSTKAFGQYGV